MESADVNRMRQLFSGMEGVFDDDNPDYHELVTGLQTNAFMMKADLELSESIASWSSSVSVDGMAKLYVDMLMSDSLVDRSPMYIRLVLYAVSFLACSRGIDKAQDELLGMTNDVWRRIWERREWLSALSSQGEDGRITVEYWIRLVCTWAEMYIRKRGHDISPECYLPHVGLHLWILFPDSLDAPYQCTLNAVGPFILNPFQPLSIARAQKFYIESVQAPHGAGGDALAIRLISELQGGPSSLSKLSSLILPTLSWLSAGVQNPFISTATSHGIIRELKNTVDKLAQLEGEHTRILVLSQKVAMQVARAHIDDICDQIRGTVTLRTEWPDGEDLATVLVQGLNCVYQSFLFSDHDGMITTDAAERALIYVQYSECLADMQDLHPQSLQYKLLLQSLRKVFQDMWWPALMRLRPAYEKEGVKAMVYSAVALGRQLGLDPVVEQARHERLSKTRCCWWACHGNSTSLSSGALPVCKGCGEKCYCSRECQKRDWSIGRHKLYCKRVKS